MRAKRFHVQDVGDGWALVDDLGTTWAAVPVKATDAEAFAGDLLDIARKAYSLGVSDAYAGKGRTFDCRKGEDADGAATWELVSIAHPEGVKRMAVRPRSRFRVLPDPARGLLSEVARRTYAAGATDGRGAGAGRGANGSAAADFWA